MDLQNQDNSTSLVPLYAGGVLVTLATVIVVGAVVDCIQD
jgi:hypothetical protein